MRPRSWSYAGIMLLKLMLAHQLSVRDALHDVRHAWEGQVPSKYCKMTAAENAGPLLIRLIGYDSEVTEMNLSRLDTVSLSRETADLEGHGQHISQG